MVKDCRRGQNTNHSGIKQIIFHQQRWEFRSRGRSEGSVKMEKCRVLGGNPLIPTAAAGSLRTSPPNQNLPRTLINLFTWFVSNAFSDFFRPLRTKDFFSFVFFFLNSISTPSQGCPALLQALDTHLAPTCANRRYRPFDMFCLASISRVTRLHRWW